MWVWSLSWEDLLEKEMATHSSVLAGRISWIEEPGRLQSIGLQRVGHNWATEHKHTHTHTHTTGTTSVPFWRKIKEGLSQTQKIYFSLHHNVNCLWTKTKTSLLHTHTPLLSSQLQHTALFLHINRCFLSVCNENNEVSVQAGER